MDMNHIIYMTSYTCRDSNQSSSVDQRQVLFTVFSTIKLWNINNAKLKLKTNQVPVKMTSVNLILCCRYAFLKRMRFTTFIYWDEPHHFVSPPLLIDNNALNLFSTVELKSIFKLFWESKTFWHPNNFKSSCKFWNILHIPECLFGV